MRDVPRLLLMVAWSCTATTPIPGVVERSLLDRIGEGAREGLPTRTAALEALQRVASAHMDEAGPNLETQVGLKPGELRTRALKDPSIRAHALRTIGKLSLPEALEYLQNLKREELGPEIWPAAQIALSEARVSRIADEGAKIRFLEDTLSQPHDAWANSELSAWVVNELCNRGSHASLGFIQASIRYRNPTPAGESQIAFCEARMAIVSRDPDRAKALGSFLSVSNGVAEPGLSAWAINQLSAIGTSAADAELDRYAKEIDALPADSPLADTVALRGQRLQIRDTPRHRPAGSQKAPGGFPK